MTVVYIYPSLARPNYQTEEELFSLRTPIDSQDALDHQGFVFRGFMCGCTMECVGTGARCYCECVVNQTRCESQGGVIDHEDGDQRSSYIQCGGYYR